MIRLTTQNPLDNSPVKSSWVLVVTSSLQPGVGLHQRKYCSGAASYLTLLDEQPAAFCCTASQVEKFTLSSWPETLGHILLTVYLQECICISEEASRAQSGGKSHAVSTVHILARHFSAFMCSVAWLPDDEHGRPSCTGWRLQDCQLRVH